MEYKLLDSRFSQQTAFVDSVQQFDQLLQSFLPHHWVVNFAYREELGQKYRRLFGLRVLYSN